MCNKRRTWIENLSFTWDYVTLWLSKICNQRQRWKDGEVEDGRTDGRTEGRRDRCRRNADGLKFRQTWGLRKHEFAPRVVKSAITQGVRLLLESKITLLIWRHTLRKKLGAHLLLGCFQNLFSFISSAAPAATSSSSSFSLRLLLLLLVTRSLVPLK